jgi:hypothetical protein
MLISKEDWTTYFKFLDALRESGATNMFGAGAYLTEAFEIPKGDAGKILRTWMETFGNGQESAEIRAEKVS